MPAYNYGDCVYFKNMDDTPNEHYNNFILNQIPYFHITSLLNLCGYMFESLPNLFLDKMIKNNFNHMSKLWLIYHKSMYEKKMMKK